MKRKRFLPETRGRPQSIPDNGERNEERYEIIEVLQELDAGLNSAAGGKCICLE
jgi:hypothetical protein